MSVTAIHALAGGVWRQVVGAICAFCQPEIEEVEGCPPKYDPFAPQVREMGKAYLLSAAPLRAGRSSTWKEQWGDPWQGTLLCYQERMADHIHPDHKHWGFPLLSLQTFLLHMVSLHQAEIKGDSGAVLLPQGTRSSKNIPLLLRAKGSHVLPLFPLFSSWLLGSSCAFSSKTT